MRALLVLTLLGFLFVGCSSDTPSYFCTFNSDCPDTGTIYCIQGLCQPKECLENRDCPDDSVCLDGACVPADDAGTDGSGS
jgi:hypothetical protein